MAGVAKKPDGAGGPPQPERPARSGLTGLERHVERIILEAQAEGEFEGIGGEGRRLPLTGSLEEAWWIKEKLRREKLSDLPDALAIRREAEQVLASLERESDERVVRERLEALNARIRRVNRTTVAGPATSLAPVDVEAAVARWRAGARGAVAEPGRAFQARWVGPHRRPHEGRAPAGAPPA